MESTPRPGTSGTSFGALSDSTRADEVDLTVLEVELKGLTRLLEDNGLKIVPSSWTTNNKNDYQVKKLQDDADKLKGVLSAKQRALDAAEKRIPGLIKALTDRDKLLHEQSEQNKREVEGLKEKLNETERKIESTEEAVRDLNSKLDQANRDITAERTSKDRFAKEKIELERKLNLERAEFQRRLQNRKSELEENYQEDRIRRGNEIIALKNENERLISDQFRFMGFARNLANWSGISCEDGAEILSTSFIEHLSSEIKKSLEKSKKENSELMKKRDIFQQMEDLILANKRLNASRNAAGETRRETGQIPSTNSTPSRSSFSSITPPTSPGEGTFVGVNQRRTATPTNGPSSSSSTRVETMDTSPGPPVSLHNRTLSNGPPVAVSATKTSTTLQDSEEPGISSKNDKLKEPANKVLSMTTSIIPSSQDSRQQPSIVIPLATTTSTPVPLRPRAPMFSQKYKQRTEFVITTKRHGIKLMDRSKGVFTCLCERNYQRERSLKVHIRKMTDEWKHKCKTCKQHFFYPYELTRHLSTNPKCGGDDTGNLPHDDNNSVNGGVDAMLSEFLRLPPPPQGQAQLPHQDHYSSSSTVSNNGTISLFRLNKKGSALRKLQQEILRKKKHAPWISRKGTVQGAWYCSCGSKFASKANLSTHVDYYTKDWKFKCPCCHRKFFYLGILKKHMASNHRIPDPLKEYSVGCHLCGEMFYRRDEYYRHRRTFHNLHRGLQLRNHQARPSNMIVLVPRSTNATTIPALFPISPPTEEMETIDVDSQTT